MRIAASLLLADACQTAFAPIRSWLWGSEPNDAGMTQLRRWLALPSPVQQVYVCWVRYARRDPVYASLLASCSRSRTVKEYYALVAQREAYRAAWFDAWRDAGLDFVISVPNALPAVPEGGMKTGFKACGYSFLFNLVSCKFF